MAEPMIKVFFFSPWLSGLETSVKPIPAFGQRL
jgi:hypothetical protein